jgi:hypothetical protein
MGLVYAEIELLNSVDLGSVRCYKMDIDEVRKVCVNMPVDSGAYMPAINENIQSILQLTVIERRRVRLANNEVITCDIVGPIDVRFKNRSTSCRAMVLPGDSAPLPGAIPMQDLDVIINPLRQELTVNPESPEMAMTILKTLAA